MRMTATSFAAVAVTLLSYVVPGVWSDAAAQESIRTGDGLVMLSATMPEEIRVGEQFTYTVKVTNSSDNVVLHDIELAQRKAAGFSVDSVSMKADTKKSDTKKSDAKKSDDKKSDSKKAVQDKSKDNSDSSQMTISVLMPGESKTFEVKATADKEGELRSCLEIASYKPAVCLTSKVVKPQLELTKTAPEKADRCNVIELVYTVKNGGSGDVGPIVISDDLGDGLATIDGEQKLKFDVDGLKAGDSRKFVARVYAREAGTFSSRALASAKKSDLKSRSQETTTEVLAAELNVEVKGASRIYGNQVAQFTAMVTNTGNSDARDVNVTVMWPAEGKLADLGDVSKEMSDNGSSNKSRQQGEPTVAKKNDDQKSSKQQKGKKDQPSMSEKSFSIPKLAAGETATFEYAIRPGSLEEIPTKVKATYVCTVDAAEDSAKAKSESVSIAMVTAKVVRLPALQIVVLDDEDPVADGSQVVYTIRVWNEGDAKDNDVKLVVTLPKQLEFASAQGPTKHSQDGSTISFEPIKTLNAGDRKDYKVTAKAKGDASVRVKAELTSKMLDEAVVSEEPTQLFKQQANN